MTRVFLVCFGVCVCVCVCVCKNCVSFMCILCQVPEIKLMMAMLMITNSKIGPPASESIKQIGKSASRSSPDFAGNGMGFLKMIAAANLM